jgi:hypothetical protein
MSGGQALACVVGLVVIFVIAICYAWAPND